jgi:drug/metabolite transporter (DMT)-like permease
MLKGSENPLALATRAVSIGAVASFPVLAVVWLSQGRPGLPPIGFLLAVISGGLELVYFISLSAAYQRGELSVVYPIARGTAPLLAVLVGLLLLGERLAGGAFLGVALLLVGIWAVRRPAPAGPALVPALLTGVMIAAYTSVDRIGVRLGPPWLYGWLLWFFEAGFLLVYARLRGSAGLQLGSDVGRSVVVAVLMTGAYFLILFALSLAPLAIVAPLRESAIVLVTAWGIWRLGERRGAWFRIAGALAIVCGIALLALSA